MAPAAKSAATKVRVRTPVGRFSFPYLSKPDTGRTYSDNKFKVDLLIPKAVFAGEEGKALRAAVLKVGREYFGKPAFKLTDFKNPFKDMDEAEDVPDQLRGHIMIKAKSSFKPTVVSADTTEMGEEEIASIKGGDYGRLVVTVYPYSQQGGGVTMGLNLVQFKQAGEAFGQGKKQILDMIDEMEVTLEDPAEEEEQAEEEEVEVAPKKAVAVKKAVKKPAPADVTEDDLNFEDDE